MPPSRVQLSVAVEEDREEAKREPDVKNEKPKTVLVAGGAGVIGSHLIDALLAEGATVLCLDSYLTGRPQNLHNLERESLFDVIEGDVIDTLPTRIRRTAFTHIFNLACAASPPHYQADPEHTMLTNVLGARSRLRLAEEKEARFLL